MSGEPIARLNAALEGRCHIELSMITPTNGRVSALVAVGFTILVGACTPTADPFADASATTPQLFAPDVVSSDAREYGIAFTPDMTEAYFARRFRRGSAQIYVTRYVDGAWSEAELAPFASERDEAPFITPDGNRMIFSSGRFIPGSLDRSPNIWTMERTEEGKWAEPEPLAGIVNQPRNRVDDFTLGSEVGPVLLPGGALLYSTGTSAEWGSDLYVAEPDERGEYTDIRALRLNGYGDESNPAVSPDGRHLVFQGYRDANGVGEQDIYVAERTEYGWGEPRTLPEPINSALNDGWPSFSPDGRFFFFASDRRARAGYYDIYFVDVEALGLDSSRWR